MKDLIIIGASGQGRETYDKIERINQEAETYNMLGFIDDDESLWGTTINTVPVLGGLDYVKEHFAPEKVCASLAIASADIKKKIVAELSDYVTWETIIDRTAIISNYCTIGKGCTIGTFSIISSNATVGDFCTILDYDSIGHDAVLEDYVSIMDLCDITGHAHLEEGVYVGSSVTMVPDVHICSGAVLGAGAVVTKDITEPGAYIGAPARKLEK